MNEQIQIKLSKQFDLVVEVETDTKAVYYKVLYSDNGEIAEPIGCELIGLIETYGYATNNVEAIQEAFPIMIKISSWIDELNLSEYTMAEVDSYMEEMKAESDLDIQREGEF